MGGCGSLDRERAVVRKHRHDREAIADQDPPRRRPVESHGGHPVERFAGRQQETLTPSAGAAIRREKPGRLATTDLPCTRGSIHSACSLSGRRSRTHCRRGDTQHLRRTIAQPTMVEDGHVPKLRLKPWMRSDADPERVKDSAVGERNPSIGRSCDVHTQRRQTKTPAVSRRRLAVASRCPASNLTRDQFSWQVAGLAEVNSALVAHSGWSMNGLRLPWKLKITSLRACSAASGGSAWCQASRVDSRPM